MVANQRFINTFFKEVFGLLPEQSTVYRTKGECVGGSSRLQSAHRSALPW